MGGVEAPPHPSHPAGTVFITGAGGFVGIHLVRGLAERGWRVVASARRPPEAATERFLAPVAGRVEWVLGDVTRAGWLVDAVGASGADVLFHGAAITPSASVEREATEAVIATNLGSTVAALEAARVHGLRRLIFASSTGIYAARALGHPRSEEEHHLGHNLYAVCKLASEGLVSSYRQIHGISACSVRIGSVYGPMERPSQSRGGLSWVARLLPWAASGAVLRVAGIDFGRDLIYTDDVSSGVDALLRAPTLSYDRYNLASEAFVPLRRVLEALAAESGAVWHEVAAAEAELCFRAEDHRDGAQTGRLREDTGWVARVALEAGLAATLRDYRQA